MKKVNKRFLPVFLFIVVAFTFISFGSITDVYATEDITITINEGTTEEEVPTGTNIAEYINAKKQALIDDLGPEYNITDVDIHFEIDEEFNYYQYAVKNEGATVTDGQIACHYVLVSLVRTAIPEVNITIKTPSIGTNITQSLEPDITLGSTNYGFTPYDKPFYIVGYPAPGEDVEAFNGTVEANTDYFVEIYLVPAAGYKFDTNTVFKVNGKTTNYQIGDVGEGWAFIFAKVNSSETTSESTEETKTTYTVLNGAEQNYNTNSDDTLTFRLNIAYTEFLTSGNVYIDNELVDPSNYTSEEGSTIIHFKKTYSKKLKSGNHTLKVSTANGEVTTTFTINKNPNTGNNISIYFVLFLTSIIGIISSIVYFKKCEN